ncbi:hypothetical protein QAD02_007116 [Eretmocerus hayati]|uniref:Uncharacterized protein n=1 Tax=Eretmocerus hayati TaxID=131215 RepID=A0ACC2N2Q6_9HYME|nr:hypothetical protein QAD02_007116 [Eretmocerus hayati]
MGKVHHLEADYRPFTISAWCGRGEPEPIDICMDPLVEELHHSCEHGIIIDGETFEIQIKCIICDRPARAAFKCIINHGAYYACERCLVPGFDYMSRKVYPFKNDPESTDESFKKMENALHHAEDLLDKDEYNHFLLFHTGSRILCSSELYKQYTPCAKEYLQRFAMLSEEVYGLHFASLTNHSLAHVADDVGNMECPASFFTAFLFENELGECKRFIRSSNRPLGQICTKVERDLEFNFKKAPINTELQISKSKQIDYLFHVRKLKFKNYQFSIKKPDNIIWFKDGYIVKMKSMITSSLSNDPTRLLVIGEQIEILKPAFSYPTCSSLLGEYSVKRRSDGNLVKFPLSDMKGKYCSFKIFGMP